MGPRQPLVIPPCGDRRPFDGIKPAIRAGAARGATLRIARNDNDYSLGDRYRVGVWGARRRAGWLSTSLRVNLEGWGNVDGADPLLNPA